MPSVTGYTTTKVDSLVASAVVGGSIVSGELILNAHDGSTVDVGTIADGIPTTSTTNKGIVELATDVETATGTDSTRAVTPFGMASVVSSTAARGLVELATSAETLTGTDTVRAVTPAGLASLPAVKIVTGLLENAAPTAYPSGVSLMDLGGSTWSLNGGTGMVVTTNPATDYANQKFHTNNGGTNYNRVWTRDYKTADGGWSPWQELSTLTALTPASYAQTSAMTTYPVGWSRLYYTSSNSSSWDFAGKFGEVVTYYDGVDFAKQEWTLHGNGVITERWIRTANASSGWTPWLVVAEDTTWQSLGTLTSGYTLEAACKVRRRNGIVFFQGAFIAPSGGYTSTGLVIPAGFRPPNDRSYPVTTNSASVTMSATVTASGLIQTWTSGATSAWFHIAGISYPIG